MLDEKIHETHETHGADKPQFIFCKVSELKNVSGGERYDIRLRDITSEMPEVSVGDFVLYEDGESKASESKASDSVHKLSWFAKILAPLDALRRVLKYRKEILKDSGEERGGIVWHFNSSKCIYFLPAMIALRAKGDSCVAITHHPMFVQFGGVRRRLYRFFEMMFLGFADVCYTPSEYTRDVIKSELANREVEMLPIPFEKYSVDSENSKNRDEHQLLYVGTLESRKGLHKLIEAMKMLRHRGKEFSLKVVGKVVDEGYFEKIKGEVERSGLAVEFCGYVGEAELEKFYGQSGMLVHPSAAEGYGIVIVEALRAGLPVVAFRNTAIPYVLGYGKRGLMCEDGNPEALAEGILIMSQDEGLRERYIEAGRRYVASLPDEKEFRKGWRKILNKALTLNNKQ